MRRILVASAAFAFLAGCAGGSDPGYDDYSYYGFGIPTYRLIPPHRVTVARGTMQVSPGRAWNRAPRNRWDSPRDETWTLNGPLLDGLTFIGGLENGRAIVRQRRRDERQVALFRPDMSPPEIASMIETFYRVRAGTVDFRMTGLTPRPFLGYPGFQFDYDHLGGNEVWRRGRAVGAVINGRLYLALFDAARMHYFPAGISEFERIVNSARLRAG